MRPSLLQTSMLHTEKDVAHMLHFFMVKGSYITTRAPKLRSSVARNTAPINLVSCTFRLAPVFLACRTKKKSVTLRSSTSSLILALLTSSRIFYPSHHYFLNARRWLVLENLPSSVMAWINSVLVHSELGCFSFADATGFLRPRPYILIDIFPRITMRGVRDFDPFRGKGEATSFSKEDSTPPLTCLPYYSLRFVKISAPIGSHVPPQHNFPEDISPWFRWYWLCSAPISLCTFSTIHIWNCRPR